MAKSRLRTVFKILLTISLLFLVAFTFVYGYLYFNKKEILNYVNDKIKENINGKASIEDIDFSVLESFPNISIKINEIHIEDSVYKKDLFYAKNVFFKINFRKIIYGELYITSITLQDCKAYIIKDSSGYTNLSVFNKKINKRDTTNSKLIQFSIHTILLRNVACEFHDLKKNKHHGLVFKRTECDLDNNDRNVQFHIVGGIYVNGLLFKAEHGAFLSKKDTYVDLNFKFNKEEKSVDISESLVKIEGQFYNVKGGLILGEEPTLHLNIVNKNANYKKIISILSAHIQEKLLKFNIENDFSYEADLSAYLNKAGTPHLHVNFETKKSTLDVLSYKLENTNLKGLFTTQKDSSLPASDDNSALEITSAEFLINNISFLIKGKLTQLKNPVAEINAVIQSDLKNIENFVDNDKYQFDNGRFKIKAVYSGPILHPIDSIKKRLNGRLEGNLEINNGSFNTDFRNFKLSGVNAHVDFNNSDATITLITFLLNNNPITLSGNAKSIIPYLLFPGEKMKIALNLNSSKIDLGEIISTSSKKVTKAKKETQNKKNVSNYLNKVMGAMSADIKLKVDKLIFRKLTASAIDGEVTVNNNSIHIRNLNMNFAQGSVRLNGKLKGQNSQTERMEMSAKLKNINISSLFYAFNNFNQQTIQAKNIEGRLNSDLSFNCLFNKYFDIISESMYGNMHIVLNKGSIKELEPMRKISKIIFKNRDLMNIKFDRIDNRFVLIGNELYIKEMRINSTALSLSVQGIYSFKDKTDMSIRIPLKNLKKRKEKFYNIEDSTGTNILLRAKEKEGKVAIYLDLFNKYAHKK